LEKGVTFIKKQPKENLIYDKDAANHKKIAVIFDYDCSDEDEHCYTGEFLIISPKYIFKAGGFESIFMGNTPREYPPVLLAALGLIYDIYKEDTSKHLPRCFEGYDLTKAMQILAGNKAERKSDIKRFFQAAAFLMELDEDEMKEKAKEELENITEGYEFNVRYTNRLFLVGTKDIMLGLLSDIKKDRKKELAAARFYKSVVDICLYICKDLRELHGIRKILLSGKMFDEDENLCALIPQLVRSGFEVEKGKYQAYTRVVYEGIANK
jgi:hydrogenase maturation factor HypF (carbamoyltransferase family)